MPVFGFSHIDVLQRAVEVPARLHRRADTAGEIEIPQGANVIRNDDFDDGVDRHDQRDMSRPFAIARPC